MPHFIRRDVGVRGAGLLRPIVVETLEPRRLLTVLLSLNLGELSITEQNDGVANYMTIQVVNNTIQVSEPNDTLNENQALYNDGWLVNNQDFHSASGPETGITGILIDSDDGQDTLFVKSMNLPLFIIPRGAASENIELGQTGSPNGVQQITAPITFDGTHAASAELSIDDGDDPNNVDPTITSTSVVDFAAAPINFTPTPQGSSATPTFGVDCSTGTGTSGFVLNQDPNNPASINYQFDSRGRATMGVENINANSKVLIDSQIGASENVFLGSAGLLTGIRGGVEIEGNQGTADLQVNDSEDTTAHTFAVRADGSEVQFLQDGVQLAEVGTPSAAFTLDTGPAANTVEVNDSISPFTTTIQSSSGGDTIDVDTISHGSEVDLIGGAGIDHVSLRADAIDGTVHISNPTGTEAVTFDSSEVGSPQVISVSDSQVTGISTGTVTMANLSSLSVIGGKAFDNFSVTPSATVPITVDGGPTTSGPSTDRLDVSTTSATGTQLSLQSGTTSDTGTYTFTNRQPINFTRFATITPTFGDFTGTVYNAQTGAAVAGATVVVDENSNLTADAGEPTTTTDANGTFTLQGLPTGTFPLLATAPGLQSLDAVSVTVSAGVLATPIMLPVLPPLLAGGPDLVATVVAAAKGKTGSIKPRVQVKVSNVGASMASAAALQIVLAASVDNVLDPADQPLLTTTTSPILLKAKKSKTYTFTGTTAASLSAGNYFILASVDSANAVAEANESNNVAASAKTVALAPPVIDLTGKFGKLPKTASAAKLLNVSFTMQNLGTIAASGTIDFDFFASTDQTLDGSDASLGSGFPIAAHVAAGKTQPAHFKLSLSALPAGSYYLVAKVNSTASIPESDSTNNIIFSTTAIAIS